MAVNYVIERMACHTEIQENINNHFSVVPATNQKKGGKKSGDGDIMIKIEINMNDLK
jgi:uncharacterized membrane protein